MGFEEMRSVVGGSVVGVSVGCSAEMLCGDFGEARSVGFVSSVDFVKSMLSSDGS